MSNDRGSSAAPDAIAVTISNNKITSTVNANIQWKISGNAYDGYTFYPNGSSDTWLYNTNGNNGVRVGTNTSNKAYIIDNENGYLKSKTLTRRLGIYNSSWRSYTSTTSVIKNQTFSFYKKVVDC